MSDFLVGIQKIGKNTEVQISPLSVTPDPGARGIADVNVVGCGRATLKVYVTDQEKTDKKVVKKYTSKKRGWKKHSDQTGIKKGKKLGKWKGYIEIKLKAGDPPIAVG